MPTRRTTLGLLLLFLSLLTLFLWSRHKTAPPAASAPPTPQTAVSLFPQQSLFTLRQLTVQRTADQATVRLTYDGQDHFQLVEPIAASGDKPLLLTQLGAFIGSRSHRTLSGSPSDFGLAPPTHQITVTFETAVFTLAIGNLTPTQTHIYIQQNQHIRLLPAAIIQPLLHWPDQPPVHPTASPSP